ncbi:MAG: FecR domain-containing protein [Elusimicrobiota bacterium]
MSNENMKKLAGIIIAVCLVTLISVPSYLYAAVSKGNIAAIATQVVGKVSVTPAKTKRPVPMRAGMFLYEGDEIKTDRLARSVITFVSGSDVKIGGDSEFKIETDEVVRGQGNLVRLRKGTVMVNAFRKGTNFKMRTPVATIAVRGTNFGATVQWGNEKSKDSDIEAKKEEWKKQLAALGETVEIDKIPETLRTISEESGIIMKELRTLSQDANTLTVYAEKLTKHAMLVSALQLKVETQLAEGQVLSSSQKSQLAGYIKAIADTRKKLQVVQSELGKKQRQVGSTQPEAPQLPQPPPPETPSSVPPTIPAGGGNECVTTVTVFEGIVQAANDYGSVDVKANEQTTIGGAKPPEPPVPTQEGDKQQWEAFKEEKKIKNSVKIAADKTSVEVGESVVLDISVMNDKGEVDKQFTGELDLNLDAANAQFSADGGKSWGAKKVAVKEGKGKLNLRSTISAKISISVSGKDIAADGLIISFNPKLAGTNVGERNKTLILEFETEDGTKKEIKLRFER